MTSLSNEYYQAEQALDQWRASRTYAPVGCAAAETTAFIAGWEARSEHPFNVLRQLDEDEIDSALERFRPLA